MKKADLHDVLRTRILDLSLAPGSALEKGSLCAGDAEPPLSMKASGPWPPIPI